MNAKAIALSSSRILTSRDFSTVNLTVKPYLNQTYKYFLAAYICAHKKCASIPFLKNFNLNGIYLADAEYYFNREITSIQDLFFLDVNVCSGVVSKNAREIHYKNFSTVVDILKKYDYDIVEIYPNSNTDGNMIVVVKAKQNTIKNIVEGKYSLLITDNEHDLLEYNMRHLDASKENKDPYLQAIHHAYFAVMNTTSSSTVYRDYFHELLKEKLKTDTVNSTDFCEADFKPLLKDEVLNYTEEFEYFVGLKSII